MIPAVIIENKDKSFVIFQFPYDHDPAWSIFYFFS